MSDCPDCRATLAVLRIIPGRGGAEYWTMRCTRCGGITAIPGLYFLGLQWLSKLYSAFLSGVGDDAAVLAEHISARG